MDHGENVSRLRLKKRMMHKMCENTGEYTMYIYIYFKSWMQELRINCRIFLCIYRHLFRIYMIVFIRKRRAKSLVALKEKIAALLKNKRIEHSAIVICAALLCLIAVACISIHMHSSMQRKYASAAEEAQEQAYQNMIQMTELFARVDDPNVDVQNKLIPSLKAEYTAVISLNETLINGFGDKYAVLSTDQIAAFDAAFAEYAAAYSQGNATGLARDDMAECIAGIQEMIDERYKPSEEEMIGTLVMANTPVPEK